MSDREWIDISVPVAPGLTPIWPEAPDIVFERRLDLDAGDAVTDTTISLSVHTGTHIDAPSHFLRGGATVDAIPPARLIGACHVADLRGVLEVSAAALDAASVPAGTRRLLLLTDNSARWSSKFELDFVGLTPDASRWVVARGIEVLGVDYLSVQPFTGSNAVHEVLLKADVVILEGIDLTDVSDGAYEMICLPLALVGTEGAPARAMIRATSVEQQ
ncbi:MAG: arylformamidase [Bradymonadia bacterium]|jgi:arylformamidase